MTYPYAGDGRSYTGPSYHAMAILGALIGTIIGILIVSMPVAGAATADPPLCRGCPTAGEAKRLNDFLAKQAPPVKVAPAPLPPADPPPVVAPVPPPAPVVAPAAPPVAAPVAPSPVSVSSGPGGETTISIGTLAGQALNWILGIFAIPIGTYAVIIMQRVLTNLKIPMTDAARAKIKEMVVNGVNLAGATAQTQFAGQGNIVIKNEVVSQAVKYVQAHGADSIKALGLDPTSPAAEEAIKAWIATAIADPTVPTPAVLDPPKPAADPAAPAKAA